ncbi:SAM-dependent methyltransferase [Endozoicomonas montiporae]|uniref:Cyclopropane-fatty-acyl-phospholipid synthase n=1 Tax=Endozoicomonas montiporae CL-33 TaxID=570277 RepID=A0A142BG69_9GAMM|nr:cyclopropane-fatty-acyl-phospholipid synthase family protein [Endozoicomonas montiporae]AMO57745.1 cyclopropane-fatty-acyl-phospholipid synthase [Endozoicomonas montiporae CL-33]
MNTSEELTNRSTATTDSSSVFSLPLWWLKNKLDNAGVSKMIITLESGEELHTGTLREDTRVARIKLHRPLALMKASRAGINGLAESYMSGDWSTADLVAVTDWAMVNEKILASLFDPNWFSGKIQRLLHLLNNNSRKGSRKNIAAHYDLGNAFYQPWLDSTMTYSSALFHHDNESLEQGQHNKYNQVLNWLDVQPDQSVLEIGCGWGGFSKALAKRQDSNYHGVTLSTEQLTYARETNKSHRHQFSLTDYRDINGQYDRLVSIEMIEAVGENHWPVYFKKLYESLKPGGIAVLQVITIDEDRFDDYRKGADFIQRYIFPGGMLPTHQIMQDQIAHAGLKMEGTLAFGQDYARTLNVWMKQFNACRPDMNLEGFDDRFHKMWNFYLAYCETGFKCNSINVRFYKIKKQ